MSRELTESPWPGRSTRLWPHVEAAYRSLAAEYDVVVVEGAGSPAETNLWADDIVDMRVAELAGAPVLLVADIDRGGAFAHLYGTWALLPPPGGRTSAGFCSTSSAAMSACWPRRRRSWSRPRGCRPSASSPGSSTRCPTRRARRSSRRAVAAGASASSAGRTPPTSTSSSGSSRSPTSVGRAGLLALTGADLVVLPGSKHVPDDLAWMRSTGMADAVVSAAASGLPVLGICGGLQMLGVAIDDPAGVEGSAVGLDLLPVATSYLPGKTTQRTAVRFGRLPPAWSWLDGRSFDGYEIHHGTTRVSGSVEAIVGDGLGYADGNVLGIYAHGLFESDEVLDAYSGIVPPPLDATFEQLADLIEAHLDIAWLARCLDLPALLHKST